MIITIAAAILLAYAVIVVVIAVGGLIGAVIDHIWNYGAYDYKPSKLTFKSYDEPWTTTLWRKL